jgi:hypothetical protein
MSNATLSPVLPPPTPAPVRGRVRRIAAPAEPGGGCPAGVDDLIPPWWWGPAAAGAVNGTTAALLACLKWAGALDWPWSWVLIPVWCPVAMVVGWSALASAERVLRRHHTGQRAVTGRLA